MSSAGEKRELEAAKLVLTNIATLRQANLCDPSSPYVAVFAGGTAGIGSCGVEALAHAAATAQRSRPGEEMAMTPVKVRVYIVGRNQAAAEELIARCRKYRTEDSDFRFVKAHDLSMSKDVKKTCEEIIRQETEEAKAYGGKPKIDQLLLSQGTITFQIQDTPENLERSLSLNFHSRAYFTYTLLPLLRNSTLPAGASVTSVMNPNLENPNFYPADLALRDPKHFSFRSGSAHMALLNTFFFDELSIRDEGAGVRFVHLYPGYVETNAMETGNVPGWFRLLWRWVVGPVVAWWLGGKVPSAECGGRLLALASGRYPAKRKGQGEEKGGLNGDGGMAVGTDGSRGSGSYRVGRKGETLGLTKAYKKFQAEGVSRKVWEHAIEVFRDIETEGRYRGRK